MTAGPHQTFWQLPLAELERRLDAGAGGGLTSDEAVARLRRLRPKTLQQAQHAICRYQTLTRAACELDVAERVDPRVEDAADDGRGLVFDDDGGAGDDGAGHQVASLVDRAIRTLSVERYRYAQGKSERVASKHTATA